MDGFEKELYRFNYIYIIIMFSDNIFEKLYILYSHEINQ